MKASTKIVAAASALVCLVSPAVASAQVARPDLTPQQAEVAAKYALPLAFDAVRQVCSTELSPGGFLASNADRLAAKFAAGARGTWPAAKPILFSMAQSSSAGGEVDQFLGGMPDEILRPFVDQILIGMVGQEIKPDNCTDIERALELLDPLPVENVAGLVGFVIELDNRNEAAGKPER